MNEQTNNMTAKTQIFNVVILDRSGSMERIRRAAVDGFNETLAGIKKAQEKFADSQEHFVTLVTFCSCEMKQVFDKVPAAEATPLTLADYEPCCCTPLYDAMGFTISSMRKHVKEIENAVVVVTIITDGLENASKEYNGSSIKQLVESLRKEGWTFTYMGANQNAVEVADSLSIRNSRNFAYGAAGIAECMDKDSKTRMNFFTRISSIRKEARGTLSKAELTAMADEAFDEEEGKA